MTTTLALTKDKEGISGIINIPVRDVYYFESTYGRTSHIDVYTRSGMYYTMGTMRYLMDTLNSSGYRFSKGDRSASINLDRVVRVDKFLKTAFFDDSNAGCMLTNRGYNTLIKELQQVNISFVMI
ncbi:hypothetical protein C162_21993 [Paenibacillus sp. FSL R7-269]|uniref:LytTR family transcriptional regulator DNA-binding domain-containing protein n=1 Tax=Paenibacillus sp. FSL R7-269 TaxID=1226755 RepID=UPI0003E1E219|nr:LytTR family transcriptional regulator DNA-binding domain-containing protein [Paenibacillus sp. FSL R7-269]ETT45253.1 hypothetical protein C162_21993 [Paenibacillus sp. FSL R7-269]